MSYRPGMYSDKAVRQRRQWYKDFMGAYAQELGDAGMANDAGSINMRFGSFLAIAFLRSLQSLGEIS